MKRSLKIFMHQKNICSNCGHVNDSLDDNQLDGMKNFIFKLVARVTRVPRERILEHRKYREIVFARQLAMTMLYEFDNISCTSIAEIFNMDHTTVLASMKRIQDLCDTEPNTKRTVDFIRVKVGERKRELFLA